jgi:hypothetical protein
MTLTVSSPHSQVTCNSREVTFTFIDSLDSYRSKCQYHINKELEEY